MEQYKQEQMLLEIIQQYPFLYDKSKKEYKNMNIKHNAWSAIAQAMFSTEEEVQRIWKNLRDKYARERKADQNVPSGSAPREFAWPLFQAMSFLDKHIVSRKRTSNFLVSPALPSPSPSGSSKENPWDSYPEVTSTSIYPTQDTMIGSELNTNELTEHQIEPLLLSPTGSNPTGQRKLRAQPALEVTDTLSTITKYLKEKQKPDKNLAFGQYVGLSLNEMGGKEQNFKRMKILEILNEEYKD